MSEKQEAAAPPRPEALPEQAERPRRPGTSLASSGAISLESAR